MTTVFEAIKTVQSGERVGLRISPTAMAKIHKCSYRKAKALLDLCVETGLMGVWERDYRPGVKSRNYVLTEHGRAVCDSLVAASLHVQLGLPF